MNHAFLLDSKFVYSSSTNIIIALPMDKETGLQIVVIGACKGNNNVNKALLRERKIGVWVQW